MQQPFYIITAIQQGKETDITDLIDGFSYEDCVEKDDLIKFNFKTDSVDLIDSDWLKVGAELNFKFGYIGGTQSNTHKAQITNLGINFATPIVIDIEALDKGNVMKKTRSNKIWKKQTASQIATSIASYYGLEYNGAKTSYVYENIPQGNRTDFEFLQYLALQEKDGSFHTFIKDNELRFERKDLDKKSNRLFTFGQDIVSFKIQYRETSNSGAGIQSTIQNFNPLTNETTKIDVNAQNAKDDTKLGRVVPSYIEYDANANSKNLQIKPNQPQSEKEKNVSGEFNFVPSTLPTQRIENIANSQNKSNTRKELTGNLTIEGDPTITANGIVTINGVGKKFSGNWYVVKVSHKLQGSTYMTTIELQKNAINKTAHTNTQSSVSTAQNNEIVVNESVGKSNSKTTKTIKQYNQNAEPV